MKKLIYCFFCYVLVGDAIDVMKKLKKGMNHKLPSLVFFGSSVGKLVVVNDDDVLISFGFTYIFSPNIILTARIEMFYGVSKKQETFY